MNLINSLKQAQNEGKLLPSTVTIITDWLNGNFLPKWAEKSIEELVAQAAWDELNDRFYQNMAFGTGGMRGRTIGRVAAPAETGQLTAQGSPEHPAVGSNYLNDFNVIRATIGLYRYCARYMQIHSTTFDVPKLVIAHDVRHFSRHFCELAASTWSKLGGRALIFEGPRSTPQLSFTVRHVQATAGIVITASHNPPHDNGFKAYFADGAQVTPPHDDAIIHEVNQVALQELAQFLDKDLSQVVTLPARVDSAYLDMLKAQVVDVQLLREQKPTVVFTPIHGTGGVMSVPALESFGVVVLQPEKQAMMDGRFPTVKSPNPENAEALAMGIALAKEKGVNIVIATDPDADRMGVAVRATDGSMSLLTGNMIGSVLAEYRINCFKKNGWLPEKGSPNAALIKTFVTTPLQDAIAKGQGLKCINTLTGFKWIGEKLRIYEEQLQQVLLKKEGTVLNYDATCSATRFKLLLEHSTAYVFGGEESYGYLGTDGVRDKDANAAVVMFCELAAYLQSRKLTFPEYLDQIYLKYGFYLEGLVNLYFEGAAGAQKIKNILDSYRSTPPQTLDGVCIKKFTDFGREVIKDADGKIIPPQDFYFIELENGYQYAVRGSGTEPKIKFYVFACDKVSDASKLTTVKSQTAASLEKLKSAIEADARRRAEG